MVKLGGQSGTVLAVAALGAAQVLAEFTNSFDGITSASSVTLSWSDVAAQNYPLCITVQVIDRGEDGFSANAYRANITSGAIGNSFVWTGVPYPLHWIPSGLYQLELRPMTWTAPDGPLLARSPFFNISDPVSPTGPYDPPPQPPLGDYQGKDASGMSKELAIGLGVAIGVPSIAALGAMSWCVRKRRGRATTEKRRLKRSEFVID